MMLSDIFPTGWHCTRLADMQPGDSMVVYGAGPVGLMAAYSAMIQGASKVMIVDRHPDRLRLAEEIGVVPIDDSKGDPVEQVLEQTNGKGADKGCECVGYQAHDPQGHEDAAMTMNRLVDSVRFTGHIGVVGIFLPQDQNGPDELERATARSPSTWANSGSRARRSAPDKRTSNTTTGNCATSSTKTRAKPSWIISHELPLAEAESGYQHFDARDDGWTKVVLHPLTRPEPRGAQRCQCHCRASR